jgi:hypothetical protein
MDTLEFDWGDCVPQEHLVCSGCKKLERMILSMQLELESMKRGQESMKRGQDFSVLSGEAISRLFSLHLFPCMLKTGDDLLKGVRCWKDAGKILKISKHRHWCGDHEDLVRSRDLQILVYEIVEKECNLTEEMWDALWELKDTRNTMYHSRRESPQVAKDLTRIMKSIDIDGPTRLALQKVVKALEERKE